MQESWLQSPDKNRPGQNLHLRLLYSNARGPSTSADAAAPDVRPRIRELRDHHWVRFCQPGVIVSADHTYWNSMSSRYSRRRKADPTLHRDRSRVPIWRTNRESFKLKKRWSWFDRNEILRCRCTNVDESADALLLRSLSESRTPVSQSLRSLAFCYEHVLTLE